MAGQTSSNASVFSAAEVEFLAEDDMVEIIPNVRMDSLHMICGDFGPFRPQIPTEVPLWLAIAMKKRSKCRLRPPDWMSVEKLTQVLEAERESPQEFSPLPFHYVEISRLLLDNARDDITDVYMVQSLIEDVRNVRFHKVQSGLQALKGKQHAVKLKNLSAMEVNLIRPFIVRALQSFYKHDSEEMVAQSQVQEESLVAASDRPRVHHLPRSKDSSSHEPFGLDEDDAGISYGELASCKCHRTSPSFDMSPIGKDSFTVS